MTFLISSMSVFRGIDDDLVRTRASAMIRGSGSSSTDVAAAGHCPGAPGWRPRPVLLQHLRDALLAGEEID